MGLTIVDSFKLAPELAPDLREGGAWDVALAQGLFGPGRLLVITAGPTGLAETLAHCEETDPPIAGFACCLDHVRTLADDEGCAVVAFSDEPVVVGPPSEEHRDRWADALAIAEERGYHLVDWMGCRDDMVRSLKISLGLGDEGEWWDLPEP